jgi:hypothetical protein
MADVKLAAYPLPLVEAMLAFAGPGIRRALLEGQVLAGEVPENKLSGTPASPGSWAAEGQPPGGCKAPNSAFEEWLIERWLREIRSDEFTGSAQGQYLIAEWERGR